MTAILAPLRERPMALLWGGLSLSAVGDQLYAVALTWIAVQVMGSAAAYLSAINAACVLVVALLAGRWADGWEQRWAMIGADLARALGLVVVVADWSLLGRPTVAPLILVTILLAGGLAVFHPALQSMLPALVRDAARLPAANALLDSTDRIARLLGPGMVAMLAAFVPARHFLSLDAASFAFSAVALLLIGRVQPLPGLRRDGPRDSLIASASRGFRVVGSHRLLRVNLRVAGVINGAWFAIIFLGLPLAIAGRAPGNAGLGAYGVVISAYGCMNLAATLVIGGRQMPTNPGRTVFAGHIAPGTGMLLMALVAAVSLPPVVSVIAFAAAAALGAAGGPMHNIPLALVRQTELPRGEVAAAMRAYLVAINMGILIAMLVAPSLYATLSAATVMAGFAALIMSIGFVGVTKFAAPRSPIHPV